MTSCLTQLHMSDIDDGMHSLVMAELDGPHGPTVCDGLVPSLHNVADLALLQEQPGE